MFTAGALRSEAHCTFYRTALSPFTPGKYLEYIQSLQALILLFCHGDNV